MYRAYAGTQDSGRDYPLDVSSLAGVLVLALVLSASSSARIATPGTRAKQTVRELTSLGPRVAGSAAEQRAGTFVAARFRRLGLRPVWQAVPLPRGGASHNIVARTGGGALRAIVVAHLDGVSAGPAANDNGSGAGTLLELAGRLRERPGVLFAALGAEERVMTRSRFHLGSARLLRSLTRAERRSVRLALSLDMVGVGPKLNVRGLEARPNRSATAALVAARRVGVAATYLPDRGQSDHEELTRGGVPAAWIEWRWDTCWHSACDRADRLVPGKLGAAIRLTAAAVERAT
jgi:Peptidase family M28